MNVTSTLVAQHVQMYETITLGTTRDSFLAAAAAAGVGVGETFMAAAAAAGVIGCSCIGTITHAICFETLARKHKFVPSLYTHVQYSNNTVHTIDTHVCKYKILHQNSYAHFAHTQSSDTC